MSEKTKRDPLRCRSCGVLWNQHPGVEPLCEKLRFLAAEVSDLKAQLAEAEDIAHRLADDLQRADQVLSEMEREMR